MRLIYTLFIINIITFLVLLAVMPSMDLEIPPEAQEYISQMNASSSDFLITASNIFYSSLTNRSTIINFIGIFVLSVAAGYLAGVFVGFAIPLILLFAVYNLLMSPTILLMSAIGVPQAIISIYNLIMNALFLIGLLSYIRG